MKTLTMIKRTLALGAVILSMAAALAKPAAATTPAPGHPITQPALGDGQETHGHG